MQIERAFVIYYFWPHFSATYNLGLRKSNRDFVMRVIKDEERLHEWRDHLKFVDPILTEDKEIVRLAIEKGCSSLDRASALLKDDFDIVKSAVIAAAYFWNAFAEDDARLQFWCAEALVYASVRLRTDPEMVKLVIESTRCWSTHFVMKAAGRTMDRMHGRTDGEILLSFLSVNRSLYDDDAGLSLCKNAYRDVVLLRSEE